VLIDEQGSAQCARCALIAAFARPSSPPPPAERSAPCAVCGAPYEGLDARARLLHSSSIEHLRAVGVEHERLAQRSTRRRAAVA
jgi:hypothetical protein